jgi:putative transposase
LRRRLTAISPPRGDDSEFRERLRRLAAQRRRFGYRRLHILLRREGIKLNHKKLFRIYREERLTVRRRGGRKRALGTRAPMTLPQGANQRWSLDFVSDVLADGRRFRVLVIVDDFTRECLALVVDTSISGRRVARELDAIVAARSKPLMIVSDNGTELTSHAIMRWQEERGVVWHHISPGKPVQNAFVRASTGASVTSASTSTCSIACRWHGGSLKLGGLITMPAGRTPASAVWPRTSLQPGPNRTTTGTDSGYE